MFSKFTLDYLVAVYGIAVNYYREKLRLEQQREAAHTAAYEAFLAASIEVVMRAQAEAAKVSAEAENAQRPPAVAEVVDFRPRA